jgi:hypothetical protein
VARTLASSIVSPSFTAWLAIVVVILPFSGCATTWSRPVTADAEFNLDNRACQHMNTQTISLGRAWVRDYVSVAGYKQCMEAEGYTEGGHWKGSAGWQE